MARRRAGDGCAGRPQAERDQGQDREEREEQRHFALAEDGQRQRREAREQAGHFDPRTTELPILAEPRHEQESGERLAYFDEETKEHIRPHVVEPSAGLDRNILAFLSDAYDEEPDKDGVRVVLRLHPALAPYTLAVLPVVRKDPALIALSREIYDRMRRRVVTFYDETATIGKRYRRQDEIGTPWGITVDHQTMEDDSVTLRDRDSLEQIRIAMDRVGDELEQRLKAEWRSPKLGQFSTK